MNFFHSSTHRRLLLAPILSTCIFGLAGCEKPPATETKAAVENIDADEKTAAAKLKPVKDPVQEASFAFRKEIREAYNNQQFDVLEKRAAEVRSTKEVFDNGSWKIAQFYEALGCNDKEEESMWEEHERIHREWIAAKPESITARVAYADFLANYAWKARGSGFADTVSEAGGRLFEKRLASALKVLKEARSLQEKDPCLWHVALHVALGQGWPKDQYDALLAEAKAFEPKFWGYDLARAYSLLPRWYGEPGDWEAYAEQASTHPEGHGAETYARIVIYLRGYHENIFREAKVSWPKTREGLEALRQKYPAALEFVSHTAMLATMAQDRALAKEMFDQLGDRYHPGVWRKPERFAHYRNWARTGRW